ncbi:MAG: hydrogenase-4 component E [Deltaproteobacteria bacterium]|jgi:hydrogenase-4 component E|nr:hydrogenase-4 component E [Deltaproteobacteria bacterium]
MSLTLFILSPWLQAAIGLILIINLGLLAAERQQICIRLLTLQGFAVSLIPVLLADAPSGVPWSLMLTTAVFMLIKGFFLPFMLKKAHKTLGQSAPTPPQLGYNLSVLAGFSGFAFSLWLAGRLPAPANPTFLALFAPAFATILAGLLLIVTRRKALTQIMGYLVMENGIFLLGVPLARHESFWLELSILLDVWVGIFVMVLALYHLNRTLHTTDVGRINSLRD